MSHRRLVHAAATTALITALTSSCGLGDPGPQTSQSRAISDVTVVELATGGDLSIHPGSTPSLTITAGEDVVDLLTTQVRDGRLTLDLADHVGRLGPVHYELDLPTVDAVVVTGSGHAQVDELATDNIHLTVQGSGEINLRDAAVDALAVDIEGSGRVTATGTAAAQEVRLDGSGTYEAGDLPSRRATVSVEGSGAADVHATERLDAEVSGSGSIRYTGTAQVHRTVDGSGEITGA